jgi:L-threonylcarbamoyladenylate synthase
MSSLKHRLAALQTLDEGGIVACPTEAVWGYSCDPWNRLAVDRLLRLKRRDPRKGLILVAAHERQLQPLLDHLTWDLRERLMAHWPGPYTFLLPDPDGWVPPWVKGDFPKVAVRVSAHPVVRALCDAWGGPLVSTSANRQGRPPARTESALRHALATLEKPGDRPYVLPGRTGGLAQPTQIRDLVSGSIVRPG